jgi:hypothetical protein
LSVDTWFAGRQRIDDQSVATDGSSGDGRQQQQWLAAVVVSPDQSGAGSSGKTAAAMQ